MVLAAPAYDSPDMISGSWGNNPANTPPAIMVRLSDEEWAEREGAYQASGGALCLFFDAGVSGKEGSFVFVKKAEPPKSVHKKLDIELFLNSVQDTFGLTIEELADVCSVTRKTRYNWKHGGMPNKTKLKRIMQLADIAEAWRQSGISLHKEQLFIPVIDELSVMDLLTRDTLDKEQILFAGSRLMLTDIQQSKSLEDPFA